MKSVNLLGITILLLLLSTCSQESNNKQKILTELGIVQENFNSLSDYQKTTVIREKVAAFANKGATPTLHLGIEEVEPEWSYLDALTRIQMLKSIDYHISCGQMSYLLRDIYKEFGWQATTYNFGFDSTSFTHEVTLVSVNQDQVWLQDADMNSSLEQAGKPLKFFDFLSRIKSGSKEEFFNSDSTLVKLYLESTIYENRDTTCAAGFLKEKVGENGDLITFNYMIFQPLNLYDSCHGFMTKLNRELGLSLTYEELYLKRLSSMSDVPEWKEKLDYILRP